MDKEEGTFFNFKSQLYYGSKIQLLRWGVIYCHLKITYLSINYKMNISIVIPTLDNPDDVANVIESLNLQSLLPSEIVIVDSSSNNEINELINTIP